MWKATLVAFLNYILEENNISDNIVRNILKRTHVGVSKAYNKSS